MYLMNDEMAEKIDIKTTLALPAIAVKIVRGHSILQT